METHFKEWENMFVEKLKEAFLCLPIEKKL